MIDWSEIIAEATAYVVVAVCGALVLAGLWKSTGSLRPPWLPMQRVRRISWNGFDVFVAFAVYLVIPAAIVNTLRAAGVFEWLYEVPADKSMRSREMLWSKFMEVPVTWGFLVWLQKVRGSRMVEFGITPARAVKNVALGYVAWLFWTPIILAIMYLAVWATPEEWVDKHPASALSEQALTAVEWLALLGTVVLVAPLVEEILFRGLLLPWQLRGGWEAQATVAFIAVLVAAMGGVREEGDAFNRTPVLFVLAMLTAGVLALFQLRHAAEDRVQHLSAIFTNGLFFAAVHSMVWPSPIPLFLLGMGLAWVRYRTSSLVAAVTLHVLFNGGSAIAMVLERAWQ